MSYGKSDRKSRGGDSAMISAATAAPIHELQQRDFDNIVHRSIRAGLANERYPVRRLADAANVNEKTAKNWWEKRCSPQGLQLLKLMASIPELAAEVRRLCAMEADLDPEFERELHGLIRAYHRIRERT
jgi:hypothetical protein